MTTPDSKIIVVGAGVLGLSTALHLARGGYKDITVFDRCDYGKRHYSPSKGCDAASADINKIFRTDYAPGPTGKGQTHIAMLALEARDVWLEWNRQVAGTPADQLPEPLTSDDKLFDVCGLYNLGPGREMSAKYGVLLDNMSTLRPQFRLRQFIKGDPEEDARLKAICPEFVERYHLFDAQHGGDLHGYLCTTDGVLLADKACVWAHHLCVQEGVKFVLGESEGELTRLIVEDDAGGKRATGIRTVDGKTHKADTVIMACGAWTAAVLPEAAFTVEATGGTLLFIDVPEDRKDLREKFSSSKFPIRRYVCGEGDRYFEGSMFPITREGRIKFGFRARNFTNYEDHPTLPGLRVSVPRTAYSKDPIDTVPLHGLNLVKEVIAENFPELAELGFSESRLCWYTDSTDTELVVDYVPGYSKDSLFICSGACGHGFKYLPVLGKYVRNALERKPDLYTEHWKWRTVGKGEKCNGLEEGESGPRNMSNVQMAERKDFHF